MQRIVAFTAGHDKFKAHLRKMNIDNESKFKYCEVGETANHNMCAWDVYAVLWQKTIVN